MAAAPMSQARLVSRERAAQCSDKRLRRCARSYQLSSLGLGGGGGGGGLHKLCRVGRTLMADSGTPQLAMSLRAFTISSRIWLVLMPLSCNVWGAPHG